MDLESELRAFRKTDYPRVWEEVTVGMPAALKAFYELRARHAGGEPSQVMLGVLLEHMRDYLWQHDRWNEPQMRAAIEYIAGLSAKLEQTRPTP